MELFKANFRISKRFGTIELNENKIGDGKN